jgi:hypothetical protein
LVADEPEVDSLALHVPEGGKVGALDTAHRWYQITPFRRHATRPEVGWFRHVRITVNKETQASHE